MKYKGIILNLENTIFSTIEPLESGINALYEIFKNKGLYQTLNEFKNDLTAAVEIVNYHTAFQAASNNPNLYIQTLLESNDSWSPALNLECLKAYTEGFIKKIKLTNQLDTFLESTKQTPIAIVSDYTSNVTHEILNELKELSHINNLVTAEESGAEKPDTDIFLMAAQKMDIDIEDICFIGSDFKKDIEGAVNSGIDAFWYTPEKNHSGVSNQMTYFQFSNFKDLTDFIS